MALRGGQHADPRRRRPPRGQHRRAGRRRGARGAEPATDRRRDDPRRRGDGDARSAWPWRASASATWCSWYARPSGRRDRRTARPQQVCGVAVGDLPRDSVRGDLVVSTIPVSAQTDDLVARCADVPAVFEVVYDPWPSPLAAAAQADGRVLVSGLDLLVHQAALQFVAFTGVSAPLEAMREAGERRWRLGWADGGRYSRRWSPRCCAARAGSGSRRSSRGSPSPTSRRRQGALRRDRRPPRSDLEGHARVARRGRRDRRGSSAGSGRWST